VAHEHVQRLLTIFGLQHVEPRALQRAPDYRSYRDRVFRDVADRPVHVHKPTRLLDDSVNRGQAQARPFAKGFGREERLEHLREYLWRHAGSGVLYGARSSRRQAWHHAR
jgi:hypothetical protein